MSINKMSSASLGRDIIRMIYQYMRLPSIISSSTVARNWYLTYIDLRQEYMIARNKIINEPITATVSVGIGLDILVYTCIFTKAELVSIHMYNPYNAAVINILIPVINYTTFKSLLDMVCKEMPIIFKCCISYWRRDTYVLMWEYQGREHAITKLLCYKCKMQRGIAGIKYKGIFDKLMTNLQSSELFFDKDIATDTPVCSC